MRVKYITSDSVLYDVAKCILSCSLSLYFNCSESECVVIQSECVLSRYECVLSDSFCLFTVLLKYIFNFKCMETE